MGRLRRSGRWHRCPAQGVALCLLRRPQSVSLLQLLKAIVVSSAKVRLVATTQLLEISLSSRPRTTSGSSSAIFQLPSQTSSSGCSDASGGFSGHCMLRGKALTALVGTPSRRKSNKGMSPAWAQPEWLQRGLESSVGNFDGFEPLKTWDGGLGTALRNVRRNARNHVVAAQPLQPRLRQGLQRARGLWLGPIR